MIVNYWNFTKKYSIGEYMDVVQNNETGLLYVRRVSPADMLPVMKELEQVSSPHVMHIFDSRMECGMCVSISEYVDGTTLEELISTGGPIEEKKARQIVMDICDGLSVLHARGIIHRDINPSNIMMEKTGNVKIIDFDITRRQNRDASHDTHVLGTVGYAAPEQFGFSQSDEKTDIYACGVLLNYIYTGWLPGERRASGSIGRIVEKCTKIDKDERFGSVEDLKKVLSKKHYRPESRFLPLPGFKKHPVLTSVFYIFYFILLFGTIFNLINNGLTITGPFSVLSEVIRILVLFVFWTALPYAAFGDLGRVSELIDKGDPQRAKTILKAIGILSFISGWLLMLIRNSLL